MKCIKRVDGKGNIIRVKDDKAFRLVHHTTLWEYTSKKEWKDGGRKRG